jgi:hypothetical protein
MTILKIITASLIVAGVAVAFVGLVIDGRERVAHSFDEKILDDMCDPPWWV